MAASSGEVAFHPNHPNLQDQMTSEQDSKTLFQATHPWPGTESGSTNSMPTVPSAGICTATMNVGGSVILANSSALCGAPEYFVNIRPAAPEELGMSGQAFINALSAQQNFMSCDDAAAPEELANDSKISAVEGATVHEEDQEMEDSEAEESDEANEAQPMHPGSRGDPRMNLALHLIQNNSDMSLYDALTQGGFYFPGWGKKGVSAKQCRDSSGITLWQRKNQLMRRRRYASRDGEISNEDAD